MLGYAFRRIVLVVPLLFVISFLTFILNGLSPMDPAEVVLHAQGVPVITDELIAETRSDLGMDRPLLVRYGDWLITCLQLDFGISFITGDPVWSLLGPALLNTLKLTLVSSFFIILLSIALGVVCALKEGKWPDLSIRSISFLLTSMPVYWLAALLIGYFSVKLDLLPTSGMNSLGSYVLPVAVIVVGYVGIYFRIIRSSMLSNLNADYVLYGRACGMTERSLILKVLRNSLQVAVSVFGMAIPIVLGSTVVVENMFAWPGLGTLTVNSILGRDFPIIQAYVLVLAVAFVLFNTVSDLLNAAVNPRLRKEF
ncbi:nickel/cobalt ABC transporter permease [Paenibacillus arenilitoris]|uniref:ABC transporter permease n=1 Tax=Paenibacillus arenilitoris TaxID=2772299 RepID=A0A927H5J7_9BACL|nr:nickel/cobalt ABC transporter permease [Paenibacillus arenilitoris]MBD2868487.1 ABC transporter permease [Paenibacillus arenilitoris]